MAAMPAKSSRTAKPQKISTEKPKPNQSDNIMAPTARDDAVALADEVAAAAQNTEETDLPIDDAMKNNGSPRNGRSSKEDQKSHEFVMKTAQDRNVKFVRLWFPDILGMLKSTAIIAEELENALEEGVTFDGSAIEGFAREDESDMIALPDPNTFTILPFRPTEGGAVARMFCDVKEPNGNAAETDSRYVLKRQLKIAADQGYNFYVGPEIEFFYFRQPAEGQKQRPEVLDQGGYFDLTPLDVASPLRRKTALTLEQMDIGVESSHHEGAPSQHEIDMRYDDALTIADNVMTFRLVVKEVASESGYFATFMPRPSAAYNGSGMHINMSLFKGGKNAFFDRNDPDHLSPLARKFVGGLLHHARELTLFTNQWVNSYKRLVPGFEAPTYVTWAMRNRADLVRVPSSKPGREASRRVEYRSPDSACNPYLVFALLLAAGLEGMKNNYELPPTISGVHKMSDAERHAAGIEVLPEDLNEAIHAAQGSALAKQVLGETLFNKFLENKKIEWENYRSQVHEYELERYLGIL